MATGRSTYLTKQAGEYLVAAELSRRGFIATTFTGNVPHYDIVAVDHTGGHALVQVKSIAAGSWQLSVQRFADVVMEGPRQIIRGALPEPYLGLICVFAQIARPESGPDRFFVIPWLELQRIVIQGHSSYLSRHGGIRPRKPASFHTAIRHSDLAQWEGKWDLLAQHVRPVPANNVLEPPAVKRLGQNRALERRGSARSR